MDRCRRRSVAVAAGCAAGDGGDYRCGEAPPPGDGGAAVAAADVAGLAAAAAAVGDGDARAGDARRSTGSCSSAVAV